MAPEQWQGQAEAPTTDQFGWSVMAWELLYGERPFAGETKVALATAVQAGHRRPPPNGRGVPGWLRRVIERGLATKPAGRWPTMVALLSALERGKTRARVRMGVVALAGVALLGAGVAGYRRWDIAQRVGVCETRGAEIGRAWNDDARQQLRDAFKATGVSYAATSAEKVMPWLDKQAGAWKEARTEVCLNADGTWDEDLVDRAMWCLEDRQMELVSLVAELGRADAMVVQKAVTAVAGLRSVDDCLVEGMLQRQPTPPALGREAIRDVRIMISRADSLSLAGNYRTALAVATQAREQAAKLDWLPLLAAARALEGKQLEEMGVYETAEMASTQAYFEAARSGAWNVAARSAIDLVYTVGYKRARYGDGRAWAQHADVALAHAGGPAGLFEARRFGNLAIVDHVTGAYADARALFERALYIHEQELGLDHPGLAGPLNNLANSHFSTGEYVRARTLHERALAIQEQALGAGHPDVATSLGNLANVYRAEGDYSVAKALGERALAIQEQALGPGHPVIAETLFSLANLADDVGANGEAQALFERALAIQEQALGYEHSSVAKTLNDLAGLSIRSGAYAEARALLERGRAIWVKNLGPDHPYVAMTLGNIASCYLEEQRPHDALPLLESALAIFDVHEGEQPGELMVHFDHARALLATGGDSARAVAEARKARDRLHQIDPGNTNPNSVNVLVDLDQWLAEHERNP